MDAVSTHECKEILALNPTIARQVVVSLECPEPQEHLAAVSVGENNLHHVQQYGAPGALCSTARGLYTSVWRSHQ